MRKLLLVLSIVTSGAIGALTIGHMRSPPVPGASVERSVGDALYRGEPIPVSDPTPERGQQFRKWMAPGVRVRVSGASGSATICYYDEKQNIAYVISCGHLWDRGEVTAEQMKSKNVTCVVEAFYHNDVKLERPKSYQAKVMFYSYKTGADYSLMTFTPDWKPTYFPIAPINHPVPKGMHAHSVGCDHATEVAHYDVEIVGPQGRDLITKNNSPRPGRSGGGLMDEQGYYIGVCWGTSDKSGNGIGYFTPLSVIHEGYNKNGYGWLLKTGLAAESPARDIPVVDKNGQPQTLPKDFIPLPKPR